MCNPEITRTRLALFLLSAAIGLLVSGCANLHTKQFFDTRPGADVAAKGLSIEKSRATVYFIRPRVPLQSIQYVALPPAYFGLDGHMLSIMPVGAYVPLSLPPGKHTFTKMFVVHDLSFTDWKIKWMIRSRSDLEVELEPGKIYYIGMSNTFLSGHNLKAFSEDDGKGILTECLLTKFVDNPATIDDFVNRVEVTMNTKQDGEAQESSGSAKVQLAPEAVEARTNSSASSTDFLEGLAAVLMAVLIVIGAAASAHGSESQDAPLPPPMPAPSHYLAPTLPQPATPLQFSTEPTNAADRSGGQNFYVGTNGVTYHVIGQQVVGSDGSSFLIDGATVYGRNGQVFHRMGDTLVSSDGRVCMITGVSVSCR